MCPSNDPSVPLVNPLPACYTVNCRKSEIIPGSSSEVARDFCAQKTEVNRDLLLPDFRLDPPDADEFIPRCPVCGRECDTLYIDARGEVAGCEICIRLEGAYEYLYEE